MDDKTGEIGGITFSMLPRKVTSSAFIVLAHLRRPFCKPRDITYSWRELPLCMNNAVDTPQANRGTRTGRFQVRTSSCKTKNKSIPPLHTLVLTGGEAKLCINIEISGYTFTYLSFIVRL
jgi:hypothetical protein